MRVTDLLTDGTDVRAGDYFDAGEFALRESLEQTHYWHVYRRELIRQLIEEAVAPEDRAIEMGCGTGSVATHLNLNGYHVDYGDVHREALEAAARRVEAALGDADARRYYRLDVTRQLPAERYDAVLLLDVLEHLPDDAATLRSIRRRMDRDALLVFTVPAFNVLWSPWDDMQKHKRRYRRGSAQALAANGGFRVERLTYFFFPLFFAAGGVKVLRSARAKLWAPTPAASIDGMLETRGGNTINRLMLRILALEARWLRKRDLPCGTSLFCMARAV